MYVQYLQQKWNTPATITKRNEHFNTCKR